MLPLPPADIDDLLDFPQYIVPADRPLARIHRATAETAVFATHQGGRFNPSPERAGDFGTCCLSTHPLAAFVEVFGRMNPIVRRAVDERVLANVLLPSDIILADVTDPSILGRWNLTAEINTTPDYKICQRWACQLERAGFMGVWYAARHDPSLESRSVALFGKPGFQRGALLAKTQSIPLWLERDARTRFGLRILPSAPLD